jgi:hypothetical protein
LRRDCGSLHDHSLKAFEKGVHKKPDIETEMKKLKKDFRLDKFGMVMPAAHLAATSLLGMLLVNPAWAAYQFYFTDNLTSINTSNWAQAGAVGATSSGLTAPDPNGGSLISRLLAPDGTTDGEVRATIALIASGTAYAGPYTVFGRATADARTAMAARGTFYAIEMQNPIFNHGN